MCIYIYKHIYIYSYSYIYIYTCPLGSWPCVLGTEVLKFIFFGGANLCGP